MDLQALHRFIVDGYDREELRTLCFDLGVNYDALRGEGTAAKARELILYLGRREELERLLGALRTPSGEGWDAAALYAALLAGRPVSKAADQCRHPLLLRNDSAE